MVFLPAPPWTFRSARVLYQPTFVPVDAARAVTPVDDDLQLLSLFGRTLGGVFVVDWRDSPIGPYREVAVLSALVARDFRIGAWASDIVVDTPDAVASARNTFGLPARLGTISFDAADDALAFASDDAVAIGWPTTDEWRDGDDGAGGFSLTLPSFSGRLADGDRRSPLLRYPLTLGPARSVRLRPALRVSAAPTTSAPLRRILEAPAASPCLAVGGATVVAGTPVEALDAAAAEPPSPRLLLYDGLVVLAYSLSVSTLRAYALAFSDATQPGFDLAADLKGIDLAMTIRFIEIEQLSALSLAVAWMVGAAVAGAATESWRSFDHDAAPLGVARLLRAWAIAGPLAFVLKGLTTAAVVLPAGGSVAFDAPTAFADLGGMLLCVVLFRRWLLTLQY